MAQAKTSAESDADRELREALVAGFRAWIETAVGWQRTPSTIVRLMEASPSASGIGRDGLARESLLKKTREFVNGHAVGAYGHGTLSEEAGVKLLEKGLARENPSEARQQQLINLAESNLGPDDTEASDEGGVAWTNIVQNEFAKHSWLCTTSLFRDDAGRNRSEVQQGKA